MRNSEMIKKIIESNKIVEYILKFVKMFANDYKIKGKQGRNKFFLVSYAWIILGISYLITTKVITNKIDCLKIIEAVSRKTFDDIGNIFVSTEPSVGVTAAAVEVTKATVSAESTINHNKINLGKYILKLLI